MRVTPPVHRTPHGQYAGFRHAAPRAETLPGFTRFGRSPGRIPAPAGRAAAERRTTSPDHSPGGDFPRLWKDPSTPDRERKRLLRLVVEDVTLLRAEQIMAQVRFKGGATRSVPISSLDTRATDPGVVAEIDRLLNQHTRGEIAAPLNERGLRPVDGKPFTASRVGIIERYYKLKSRHHRLHDAGLLTRMELAQRLSISEKTVVRLHADGRLRGEKCGDRSQFLYFAPANGPLRTPQQAARNNLRYEVQHEA